MSLVAVESMNGWQGLGDPLPHSRGPCFDERYTEFGPFVLSYEHARQWLNWAAETRNGGFGPYSNSMEGRARYRRVKALLKSLVDHGTEYRRVSDISAWMIE